MALDNSLRDIFVQTNATDPTAAILQSRSSAAAVQNVPFVCRDKLPYRFFLMEQDQTTGEMRNRALESDESLNIVIRSTADDATFGSFGTVTNTEIHSVRGPAFRIYIPATRDSLSGEYVAFTLLTPNDEHLAQTETKELWWYRTDGNSTPPNISGYNHHVVNLPSTETPNLKETNLRNGINAHAYASATVETTSGGAFISVEPTHGGTITVEPFTSDSSKIAIEPTQFARPQLIGYKYTYDGITGVGTTEAAMGSADTLAAKMVVELIKSTGTLNKTLAIQDVTFYRDFSG